MATILTEVLTYTVDDSCGGVFLKWENDSGAIDQWKFTGNVSEKVSTGDTMYFEKYIDEIINATSNFEVLKKSYSERLTVYTTFDKENAEGFKQLVRSRQVQMYVLGVWYQIDVALISFNVEDFNPYGKITIDIILPKKYIK